MTTRPAARPPAALMAPPVLGLVIFAAGLAGMPGLRWAATSTWFYDALLLTAPVLCAARARRESQERPAWALLAIATLSYALGDLYASCFGDAHQTLPFPSPADGFWLAFFPLLLGAMWLLARRRIQGVDRLTWLDGLIVGLGLAALSATVVFREVESTTHGNMAAIATNLAYPAGDLLALIFIVTLLSAAGACADRTWRALAVGVSVFLVTDSIYLIAVADNAYTPGGPLDFGWPLGLILIAVAAWQPAGTAGRPREHGIALPTVSVGLCVVLMLVDHFTRTEVLAVVLAGAAIAVALWRLVLTHRAGSELLHVMREATLTDVLTRLGNRARLLQDLELAAGAEDGATLLAFFDLDGFKNYNDAYGHPAGDALLQRLAERLAGALPPGSTAYRLGGDEFCALVPLPGPGVDAKALLAPALSALREQGEGFVVTTSCGQAIVPHEARTAPLALALADHRLYADKSSGRITPRQQLHSVLRRVLDARDEVLGVHVDDVARLAERTARELGLDERGVEQVVLTAELHDIGKSAIPDAILFKPAPLDPEETAFMRRHTIVGERILAGAPALAEIAPCVRASHERVDGRGYPDGLAGADIPLAARIVFVCDAYDAMTSARPYSRPRPHEEALRELRACAGTQFDAAVVEAFVAVMSGTLKPTPVLTDH